MPDNELTGNHYLCFPGIAPDGSISAITAVHSGLGGLLEWSGPPLLRPVLIVDDVKQPLAFTWDRLDRWVPHGRARSGNIEVTCTICAPAGYDPLVRGAFIDVQVRNTGAHEHSIGVALEVDWQATSLHVRRGRPLADVRRLATLAEAPGIALEVGHPPYGAALALGAAGDAVVHAGASSAALEPLGTNAELSVAGGGEVHARILQQATSSPHRTQRFVFFIGVGRDRDSALATVAQLRRLGADALLRSGRFALSQLVRRGEDAASSELLNRNLLFNHFFALGRGLDDDRLHSLSSRSPAHGTTACFNEREALFWTLPALTLNDPLLARELLLHAFELFSGAPGQPARYLDGGILAPGFLLDQLLAYPLALERYAREADDETVIDDPLVQDVLREIDAALYNRLHPEVLLSETELLSSAEPTDFPYPTLGNALLWAYARVLPKIWRAEEEEPPASFADTADEVAAAIWQRCTVDVENAPVLVSSTNLKGQAAVYDDPQASLALLPYFGFCRDDDPIWRNTMELLRSPAYPLWHGAARFPGLAARGRPGSAVTAALAADLLGPNRARALALLGRMSWPDGVACDEYDPATGTCAGGPHAAALAGFIAWALDRGAPAGKQKKRKKR